MFNKLKGISALAIFSFISGIAFFLVAMLPKSALNLLFSPFLSQADINHLANCPADSGLGGVALISGILAMLYIRLIRKDLKGETLAMLGIFIGLVSGIFICF